MLAKLEMFIALAKEQHFGRAATSLGITQPSLSTGIRQLEDQLGVQLVRRGSRFGGLTPEGVRTLVWARKIVGDARQLREEMRFAREGLAGHLRLAVIPTALTWAARMAARFNARYPNVEFTILSRSSQDVLAMLDDFTADAGISYLDNEPLGRVSTAEITRERYTMVCARDHPLARNDAVEWRDLATARLCLLTPEMQNRRIINAAFMQAGIEPVAHMESNSTVALVTHVAAGGWVTILPGDLAQFLAAGHGLAIIPIESGGEGHAVGLVAPFQEPHTPVLQALLEEGPALAVD